MMCPWSCSLTSLCAVIVYQPLMESVSVTTNAPPHPTPPHTHSLTHTHTQTGDKKIRKKKKESALTPVKHHYIPVMKKASPLNGSHIGLDFTLLFFFFFSALLVLNFGSDSDSLTFFVCLLFRKGLADILIAHLYHLDLSGLTRK